MGAPGLRRAMTNTDSVAQPAVPRLGRMLYRVRRRAATVALFALTIPIGYKAFEGQHGWIAFHQQQTETQKLDEQIRDLQARNQVLKDESNALRHDPKAIEREAREHLHYARPNDVVIAVPQQPVTK
jgi:cell division protein FtsB